MSPGGLTPWPTYHGDLQRSGMGASGTAPAGLLTAVTVALDGAVYAAPIVAGQVVIVATENDSVYGLSASGGLLWKVHLGSPTPRSNLPCGDIDPLGITGTPFYDNSDGTVFLVASLGAAADHVLFALDPDTGAVRWHSSVDLPGVDPTAMQQRGALTVTGGRVWVPFGGLFGDCGNYRGQLVGVPVGNGAPEAFTVPTSREGGIWAPPGPSVIDGDLLVAVGNGQSTDGGYDYSDSVLRVHGTMMIDSFSPTSWVTDNASDLDLGSQGPALVQGRWVFQAGKSGTGYVLHAATLGGIGGQVSSSQLCRSFGGTAVDGDVVFVPCVDGLRAITITSDGRIQLQWKADPTVTGSPVIAGGWVYALDPPDGILDVLDAASGHLVQSIQVGAVTRFATPAISGGHLYVGTLRGLTVLSG
ncbi:MAG: PQQ-binding-like beta-propeller repeat protein [Candidatus Nanopelagicales bacterium]